MVRHDDGSATMTGDQGYAEELVVPSPGTLPALEELCAMGPRFFELRRFGFDWGNCVGTADNSGDLFTKHLTQPRFFELLLCIGMQCERLGLSLKKSREINWVLLALRTAETREACEA